MTVRFLELGVNAYDEKTDSYDYAKAKFISYKEIKNVAEFFKLIKQVKFFEIRKDNIWHKLYDYSIDLRGNDDKCAVMNVYVEEYL